MVGWGHGLPGRVPVPGPSPPFLLCPSCSAPAGGEVVLLLLLLLLRPRGSSSPPVCREAVLLQVVAGVGAVLRVRGVGGGAGRIGGAGVVVVARTDREVDHLWGGLGGGGRQSAATVHRHHLESAPHARDGMRR